MCVSGVVVLTRGQRDLCSWTFELFWILKRYKAQPWSKWHYEQLQANNNRKNGIWLYFTSISSCIQLIIPIFISWPSSSSYHYHIIFIILISLSSSQYHPHIIIIIISLSSSSYNDHHPHIIIIILISLSLSSSSSSYHYHHHPHIIIMSASYYYLVGFGHP